MSGDVWKAAEQFPGGLFLIGVAIIVCTILVLFSETVKRLIPGLSAFSDWWGASKAKAIEIDRSTAEGEIQDLKQRFDRFQKHMETLETELDSYRRFEVWVQRIAHVQALWAAREGLTLPIPHFMSKAEWELWEKEQAE